ncbi:MAG TPA: glucokinase [Longimicrobiales bacterium]|nr:glucokinase [Longimicrobiales bacterium]
MPDGVDRSDALGASRSRFAHTSRGARSEIALVGDVGGTNCRFALARSDAGGPRLFARRRYKTREFSHPAEAVRKYCRDVARRDPVRAMALAVAGPVTGDFVDLTNAAWVFSQRELRNELELDRLVVMNDLEAAARAILDLDAPAFTAIGAAADPTFPGPIAVIAPGTGLGIAMAFDTPSRFVVAAEGGHIGFAPSDELEAAVASLIGREVGRVVNEHILSGPGIERLHRALGLLDGGAGEPLSGPEIMDRALKGNDAACTRTIEMFARIMGAVAGDIVLAQGAREVVLAGSIVSSLLPVLRAGGFRAAFDARGPGSTYMRIRRVRVTCLTDLALTGAYAGLMDTHV